MHVDLHEGPSGFDNALSTKRLQTVNINIITKILFANIYILTKTKKEDFYKKKSFTFHITIIIILDKN